MRSAKDILKDLGFNPDAPESTKAAFLKHLAQAASQNQKAEVIEPAFGGGATILEEAASASSSAAGQQLSFDQELLGMVYRKGS